MSQFKPESFGFERLRGYTPAPGLAFYELRNHAVVDGKADVLRLNVYLSRDGSFVNIWVGLMELTMVQGMFTLPGIDDLDFDRMYNEPLFRGHIDTAENAEVILRALRIKEHSRGLPQRLEGAPNDLHCEMIGKQ